MASSITLGVDTINFGSDGFDYPFPGDHVTATVLPYVAIGSDSGFGIFSNEASSFLINKGEIISIQREGVYFSVGTGNSVVTNAAGGLIVGTDAVSLNALGVETFNNFGIVNGTIGDGVAFTINTEDVTANNKGRIFGAQNGIYMHFGLGNGTVNNKGLVDGGSVGVLVNSGTGLTTLINNRASGIIEGGSYSISDEQGSFILHNFGKLIGNIADFTGEHNVLINHGKIVGTVTLGGGNDVFNGSGGSSGDIYAGSGNQHITAGKGKVNIHLGTGNNTVSGGPGSDHFIFDGGLVGQVDRITNFVPGVDKIVLSTSLFGGTLSPVGHVLARGEFHLGTKATSGNQHIIYDHARGALYFDPDGNGGLPQVQIAALTSHPLLHNTDFMVVA